MSFEIHPNLKLRQARFTLKKYTVNTITRSPLLMYVKNNLQKIFAVLFWLAFFVIYTAYSYQNNLSPLDVVQNLIDWVSTSPFGPLIFIGAYILRPLLFFSATLLTLASGYLFGPVGGIVYTVIGSNISASLAYVIGRYFGNDSAATDEAQGFIQRYADRMRSNSFETVLIMRFIFIPYDLVNYLAGFLRIRWASFALATLLGAIPGTVSFSLFGASIEGDFSGGTPTFNPWVLGTSILIFIASLALSRYFKNREVKRQQLITSE